MSESRADRVKRLKMRSMRRGIREMDLILGAFSGARLEGMSTASLDLYDALLEENDHDLYQWVTGQTPPPERFAAMIGDVSQIFQK